MFDLDCQFVIQEWIYFVNLTGCRNFYTDHIRQSQSVTGKPYTCYMQMIEIR